MDKLKAIETFVRVAELGSFSSVAKELGTTQSAVSKIIVALETYLDVILLTRTTRSLSLTEAGARYYEEVRRLVIEINDAESTVKSGKSQFKGNLRVAASVAFGRKKLLPLVDQFLTLYPNINVDVNLNDGFIDIVEQGVDVAIRIGDLPDSSLLARRLGTTHRALLASHKYIAKVEKTLGLPQHPDDLALHNCVIYTGVQQPNYWEFASENQHQTKVRVRGNFQTNSSEAVRMAGLQGIGICYSPLWLFDAEIESGEMQILMPDWPKRPLPLHAIYPPQRNNSPKVTAFVDYLAESLASVK